MSTITISVLQDSLRGIVLLVAALGLMDCGGQVSRHARISAPAAPTAQFEREFLKNRVAHQQAAVEMAQACIQKAQHPELKQFCGDFLKREQSELTQLQDWSSAWYPAQPNLPQGTEKMTQGYRNFLGSVRDSSGAEFEQSLLSALRLHHHEGVDESDSCIRGAVHNELKVSCQSARSEQEREIKQMNAWICLWFRDCIEK